MVAGEGVVIVSILFSRGELILSGGLIWLSRFSGFCFSVGFVALKWGGFVDVRWSMCTGGSSGLVGEGWAHWEPCIVVSMFSSGWCVVEDPGVSWRTIIGP